MNEQQANQRPSLHYRGRKRRCITGKRGVKRGGGASKLMGNSICLSLHPIKANRQEIRS
jgi:hypothetical protein